MCWHPAAQRRMGAQAYADADPCLGRAPARAPRPLAPLTHAPRGQVFAEEFGTGTSAGAAGYWEPFKLSDTPEQAIHRCRVGWQWSRRWPGHAPSAHARMSAPACRRTAGRWPGSHPGSSAVPPHPAGPRRRWGKATFQHLRALTHSRDAAAAGVATVSAQSLFREPAPDPLWADIVPGFHRMAPEELQLYSDSVDWRSAPVAAALAGGPPGAPAAWVSGYAFGSLICEGRWGGGRVPGVGRRQGPMRGQQGPWCARPSGGGRRPGVS